MNSHPAAERASRAGKLLSRAAGYISLMVAGHRLSRIGLRLAAQWAREAAVLLDEAAQIPPRDLYNPD